MSERDGIQSFLAAVRRRLLLRAGLQAAGYGAAALGVGLFALGLSAAAVGPADFWPTVTACFAGALGLVVLARGVLIPARALHDDRAAARRTGALLPAMASDLLSAVELAGAERATAPADVRGAASPTLVQAFREQVAGALAPVAPGGLVSFAPAARALAVSGLIAAALIAAMATWPMVARGLHTLVHRPSRFEGAAVSAVPLVGDVRVTYEYPAYTGLPARTVEGSTGDIAAVKGTHVRIETHPLRPAHRALLLLGERGEAGELAVALSGDTLTADLTLTQDGSYRFWLEPPFGRPIREERSHRLTAEPDAPPRVEILGPADRLELATPRPIEIGYSASDDFGLGAIELVYRIGDRPEQRVPLRDGAGGRAVQGRTVWDPATTGLVGAERIAYRIEAHDRDQIAGPKVGSSRTLYVVIQNPHQNLEDRLERQRDVLEKLLGDLAARLERDPAVAAPPSPSPSPRPRWAPARRRPRTNGWRRWPRSTRQKRRTWRSSAGCSTRIDGRRFWARRCGRRWLESPIGWSTSCARRRRRSRR